jgi:hypothetical protein
MLERFLPAEIAALQGNHGRNAALRDVNFYANGEGLDRQVLGHFTGEIGPQTDALVMRTLLA